MTCEKNESAGSRPRTKNKEALVKSPRPWMFLGFALVCASQLVGCAVFNRDNRRLLNALDKQIQPKSVAARAALAPPVMLLGTGALAVDAVVIHPATAIPDAWDDTYELYWSPREMDALRRSLFFVPCVALTPPTFVGSWLLHSLFPMD